MMPVGMISKAIAYVGCEVRLSDCLITKIEAMKNCECWEKLGAETKGAIRKAQGSFCPVCQNPIDKKVTRRELKFQSGLKTEAEISPETVWPRFLATATTEQNGTSKGYRLFPVYDKGNVRRDVVIFGVPVWSANGAYNGPVPMDPTSAKYDEVRAWLTKLGIYHQASFGMRLYFAQEPSAPVTAGVPSTPIATPASNQPSLAKSVDVPSPSRPVIKGGAASE